MDKKIDLTFILVRPRNPLNIGAAARAMANFGWSKLVVVDPYAPSWNEAKTSAVEGAFVLKKAKKVKSLKEALKKMAVVIGTSSGERRTFDGRWIDPSQLPGKVFHKKKLSVALLFGQEKTGLSNEELDFCNWILRIPTDKKCPSLNLSQTVVLLSYMLSQIKAPPPASSSERPKQEVLERLLAQAVKVTGVSGIYKGWELKKRESHLRRSLRRWDMNPRDVAMLHGIFRWVLKKSSIIK